MACRVMVRGKLFPSIKDAAKANRRSEKQAHWHLRTFGHLDYLGKPLTWERPDRRKPVRIGGHTFASMTEAAAKLGVDRKTIRNAKTNESARMTVLRALMQMETRR